MKEAIDQETETPAGLATTLVEIRTLVSHL